MLTTTRGGVLTIGVVLAVYFASSGVDSLRIALNRAYNPPETRPWWLLKLESIAYVLVAAVALLALGFLIVLAPLAFATALKYRALARPAGAAIHLHALCHRRHPHRDRARASRTNGCPAAGGVSPRSRPASS